MSDTPQEEPRPNEKGDQEFTPQIAFAMGAIKGTVENLRTDLKEWKDDIKGVIATQQATTAAQRLEDKKAVDDLEQRVRALEKWMWKTSAVISFVVAVATWLVEHFLK